MLFTYQLSQVINIVEKWFKELFWWFSFWFEAELQRVNVVGKNVYCELIELGEDGSVKAKVKGLIFDRSLLSEFLEATKLENIDSLKWKKLLMQWKINFHSEYGLGIVIKDFSVEYTIWQLKKQQDDIIERLQKLGILHANQLKQLGFPPYTVAVISSENAQWFNDFSSILQQSGYQIVEKLYPAAMHGNEAIESVTKALSQINADKQSGEKIDLIAIVRGGGEESWILWQNDFSLAQQICESPVPVILAVGHTSDKSVLDKLVRFSAKTPSDAAHILIQILEEYSNQLQTISLQIRTTTSQKLSLIHEKILFLTQNIQFLVATKYKMITEKLEYRTATIANFQPEKMLLRGYSLLFMPDGSLVSHSKLKTLSPGDSLSIKTYDQTIKVTISE